MRAGGLELSLSLTLDLTERNPLLTRVGDIDAKGLFTLGNPQSIYIQTQQGSWLPYSLFNISPSLSGGLPSPTNRHDCHRTEA